jgi:hypothetical protein
MDEYVKQSIESRRNAIFAAYDVKGELLKKVEALFAEMEKLGASCKDVGDFEAKLAGSPLNQKYLDLFTEIATNSTAKTAAPKASGAGVGKMVAGGIVAGVAESAAEQALRKVVPTRAAVNQKATDAVRGVPVLGDAIDVGQKASYAAHLGKLFRKKKK